MLVIVNMTFIAKIIKVVKIILVAKTTYMICKDLMFTSQIILITYMMFVEEDFVAKKNKGCRNDVC